MKRSDITDKYLHTLDLQRNQPGLDYLNEITRRHAAQFAFSSVGPMLGDELPLDLESLYRRIVVQRRGGYCFEQNGLLYEILRELGFDANLYLGRVIYNQDIHPGLTHRISLVEIDAKQYIADVGFGPLGPQLPVCMSGKESRESFRTFRIAENNPGEFHMQTLVDGAFFTLYKFELTRYGMADCEVGHFYSHKHPRATFVNHLVVSRIMDNEVRSLRNREYWLIGPSGKQKHGIGDGAQLREILDTMFGISINATEANRLFGQAS